MCSVIYISIHAPRAGCDVLPRQDSKLSQISIHAPRAGCDHQTASKGHSEAISIHAPRAGCDLGRKACPARTVHFNPRTPCGVRQPRAPATGATYLFQSTHPVRGATIISLIVLRAHVDFNPRTPCGVRRRMVTKYVLEKAISIHAPRAGCDRSGFCDRPRRCHFNPRTPCGVRRCRSRPTRRSRRTFQSTHPVRGATRSRAEDQAGQEISIHAPRAGCDTMAIDTKPPIA